MAGEISSSTDRYAYHVFLSFRGEDTRKHFTDHLYTALINAEIRTFRDDDEIERGENIKLELETAIRQSRSYVVVMSKDYASSGWCLDELAMIVERGRDFKLTIIPVFYDVDPSHVRLQNDSVGNAFKTHEDRVTKETDERKKKELSDKVKRWREALTEFAAPRADIGDLVLQHQADRWIPLRHGNSGLWAYLPN